VAEIVAETMDNYLLMGHILKCKVIPKSEVHPELWIGADKKFKKVPMARVYRVSHNKVRFFINQDKWPLVNWERYFIAEDRGREG
jgi:nucleolar protein 15